MAPSRPSTRKSTGQIRLLCLNRSEFHSAVYKIIGADRAEYGPVTADQIRQWLAEGRAELQTKVRGEESQEWKLLAEGPEFAANFLPSGPWTCPKCGERIEKQFDSCWRCSTPRRQPPAANPASAPAPAGDPTVAWRVEYEMFRGTLASWDELFTQAANLATEIGSERMIGISHSEDENDGVVAVWYWTESPAGNSGRA